MLSGESILSRSSRVYFIILNIRWVQLVRLQSRHELSMDNMLIFPSVRFWKWQKLFTQCSGMPYVMTKIVIVASSTVSQWIFDSLKLMWWMTISNWIISWITSSLLVLARNSILHRQHVQMFRHNGEKKISINLIYENLMFNWLIQVSRYFESTNSNFCRQRRRFSSSLETGSQKSTKNCPASLVYLVSNSSAHSNTKKLKGSSRQSLKLVKLVLKLMIN